MNASHESLDELDRRVEVKRLALSASVENVRLQLQPAALANEAGSRLKIAATDVLYRVAEKAGTPKGIGTAAAAVAVGLLTVVARVRSARQPSKLIEAAPVENDDLGEPTAPPSHHDGDRTKMIAALTMALVTGALLAKTVPTRARDEQVLAGIGSGLGSELRMAFEQWAQREVTQLAMRPAGEPLRLANAIALGIGLLLTTTNSRPAKDLDDPSPSLQ
jgi:hypothetical protein